MSTMAHIRIEPWFVKELEGTVKYEGCLPLLKETRFLPILLKLNGCDSIVAMEFSRTFDGRKSIIISLQFQVTKNFISQATELPALGEKWFKKGELEKGVWHQFLLEGDHDVD